jgi:hypothetical protein
MEDIDESQGAIDQAISQIEGPIHIQQEAANGGEWLVFVHGQGSVCHLCALRSALSGQPSQGYLQVISKSLCHSPEGTPLRDGVRKRFYATDTCLICLKPFA